MDHNDVIAAINVLGDQLLSLRYAARELPAPDFINKALQVMRDVVPNCTVWWGLGIEHPDQRLVTLQEEFIGLASGSSDVWQKCGVYDEIKRDTYAAPGHVQRYNHPLELPNQVGDSVPDGTQQQIVHTMALALGEPLTGLSFLVSIHRGVEPAFSDTEAALFAQLIRHILQLWRQKLQDGLSLSGTQDMLHAALVRTDGRVLSIGMHLCEAIYTEWPEWDGVILPDVFAGLFADLPQQMRLGSGMVNISARAGYIYLELGGLSNGLRLSPREQRVAHLYAAGYSYKEIARQVNLTPATVRTYLQRAYFRLGVSNKIQLRNAFFIE